LSGDNSIRDGTEVVFSRPFSSDESLFVGFSLTCFMVTPV
jgi:hypothetical protein